MAFHISFSVGEVEINFDSDIDPTPDVVEMFMRQLKQQALNAHVTMCIAMGEMEALDQATMDKMMETAETKVPVDFEDEAPDLETMLDED
jgi:hypothetical protein